MLPKVLSIAGSDSSGGAGIQADIKTVTSMGGYCATAITAITVQNTQGVSHILPVDAKIIRAQCDAVLTDIGADCLKIGLLYDEASVKSVISLLDDYKLPVVLDPVMVASSGAKLMQPHTMDIMKHELFPRCTLITPNIAEAEWLLGADIKDIDDLETCSAELLSHGSGAVLLKGGHLEGDQLVDVLAQARGIKKFSHNRIHTPHTHGTGCTLSSAIAVGLARGLSIEKSVGTAIGYVQKAIETAPNFVEKNGPLNHMHDLSVLTGDDHSLTQ